MESTRIANRQARHAVAVWSDDDISAVRTEEDMAAEVAHIDRLLAELDRELADQERTEQVRLKHYFTDQVRARRALRRAERGVLRSLPTRLPAPEECEGEAA